MIPGFFRRQSLPGWFLLVALSLTAPAGEFRAGAAKVEIPPQNFPVIVNGMFTERSADRVVDPLYARALVLADGPMQIVIAVVDTCMMPRELIDDAKARAAQVTGIPVERMLISATHTHSAPAAMGCLGSRADPRYAAILPALIAHAIELAAGRLQPARAAWGAFDATGFTHNRRWIRRSDFLLTDPFGERSVRAHMHPGHVSPEVVGPSGPVDPSFSLLSVVHPDGRPLAILGNFSMHYYESDLLSSDYFGRWCDQMESAFATNRGRVRGLGLGSAKTTGPVEPPVALLSQGTSGDLMWMDYGRPREQIGATAYATALAERALTTWRGLEHRAQVPLAWHETRLNLAYRVPSGERLAWARAVAATLGNRLPQTLPEIYAREQLELARRGTTELILQAGRVGEFGIAALPNEVYALTGLKLKQQSPLALTMNVSLANGAEGYIPPPEQHALGGYTTWAARTAGLETGAEPRIVEALLNLLEKATGKPRRKLPAPESTFSRAMRALRPGGYWRLDDLVNGAPRGEVGRGDVTAGWRGRYALYLEGPEQFDPSGRAVANRAVHLVGGQLVLATPARPEWSVSAFFWNGFPVNAAGETGELGHWRPGAGGSGTGFRLRLQGTNGVPGRVALVSSAGTTVGGGEFGFRQWRHVLVVGRERRTEVYLDGHLELVVDLAEPAGPGGSGPMEFGLGGGESVPFQGKLDEVAWFDRALSPEEIASLTTAATAPPATLDHGRAPR